MKISSENNLPDIVNCPTSKSVANRLLIIGALKKSPFKIMDLPESKDTKDLIRILEVIGLDIQTVDNGIIIQNSFPECEKRCKGPVRIEGSEGGTTIRFLLPFLSLGLNQYELTLKGKLGQRPFQECLDLLQEHDCECFLKYSLLMIKGPMRLDSEFIVDCLKTTQFASAFELLKIKYPLKTKFKNLNFSQKYLKLSQVLVEKCIAHDEASVTVDFSSLGYFIAYALIRQSILIKNVLEVDHLQADSYFITLLDQLKLRYEFKKEGLFIEKAKRIPSFTLDSSLCIDLAPTLMFLAAFSSGECHFKNLQFLKDKECDRLKEMMSILSFFNVKYDYSLENFSMVIYGGEGKNLKPKKEKLEVADDHRMVMVSALFMKCLNGGDIYPEHSIQKSFPSFFEIFS